MAVEPVIQNTKTGKGVFVVAHTSSSFLVLFSSPKQSSASYLCPTMNNIFFSFS